jgi:hypothetical protein
MTGSSGDLERSPFAPRPGRVRSILQRVPDAPVIGQGCTCTSVWQDHGATNPRRTSSSILPDLVCGRDSGRQVDLMIQYAKAAGPSASSRRPRTRTAIHKTVFREGLIELNSGAGGRNRTDTLSPEQDFESSASTSSATPAIRHREFPRALHLCCTWCG